MSLPKEVEFLINSLYDEDVMSVSSTNRLKLGHLLLFYYPMPKYEQQLPYFDALPLMVLLGYNGTHLHGLNLHYMPYLWRINVAERLMRSLRNKKRIRYKDIAQAWIDAKMPVGMLKLCYRTYLINRISSSIKIFNYDTYKPVIVNVLPQFKKENSSNIIRDIERKFREHAAKKGGITYMKKLVKRKP